MLMRWGFWKKPGRQKFEEASYSMLHLLPMEERKKTFERFVYESGRAASEIGFWLFDRRRAASGGWVKSNLSRAGRWRSRGSDHACFSRASSGGKIWGEGDLQGVWRSRALGGCRAGLGRDCQVCQGVARPNRE